jgi:uncharacterized Ntn-hydrolase superfamily protein
MKHDGGRWLLGTLLAMLCAPLQAVASGQGDLRPPPRAHTYSIVARDGATGEMGVAVQSHWFSVGSVVPWAEAGVGAVATQSFVEVSYGPLGLDLMRAGKTAPEALKALLTADPHPEVRQVAMIDAQGRLAVHTGESCIPFAGHLEGDQFAVQANLMATETVWPAMAEAFRSTKGDLADRMVAALRAGQAAGGDIRGRQSAAIRIVRAEPTGREWQDVVLDLRVEDHATPVEELARLLRLHRAYRHANQGDEHVAAGDVEAGLEEYAAAARVAPEVEELPFWQAVTMTQIGRVDEALPLFKKVFQANRDWAVLVPRLPGAGQLPDDPEILRKILAQAPPPVGAPGP